MEAAGQWEGVWRKGWGGLRSEGIHGNLMSVVSVGAKEEQAVGGKGGWGRDEGWEKGESHRSIMWTVSLRELPIDWNRKCETEPPQRALLILHPLPPTQLHRGLF